jgi:hypothetical protein
MIPLITSMVATTECAPKAEVAKGVSAGQPFIVSKTEVRTIPNGVIAQTEHIVDQEERPVNQYN